MNPNYRHGFAWIWKLSLLAAVESEMKAHAIFVFFVTAFVVKNQTPALQPFFLRADSLALGTMFETIVPEIEKAGGKLTHLRRFL